MLGGVSNDLFDLLGGVGIKHDIGNGVDYLVAQSEYIVCGEAVGNRQSVIIGGGNAVLPDYLAQSVDVLGSKLHGVV